MQLTRRSLMLASARNNETSGTGVWWKTLFRQCNWCTRIFLSNPIKLTHAGRTWGKFDGWWALISAHQVRAKTATLHAVEVGNRAFAFYTVSFQLQSRTGNHQESNKLQVWDTRIEAKQVSYREAVFFVIIFCRSSSASGLARPRADICVTTSSSGCFFRFVISAGKENRNIRLQSTTLYTTRVHLGLFAEKLSRKAVLAVTYIFISNDKQ